MYIDERTVARATLDDDLVKASDLGWFLARQPGLLRFLEDRLAAEPDALGMALEMCWRVVAAFEMQRGLPLPRLTAAELEQAEEEVVSESQGLLALANGCAHRQPALCRWLESAVAEAPLPLMPTTRDQLALAAAATISACDRAHALAQQGPDEPGALMR